MNQAAATARSTAIVQSDRLVYGMPPGGVSARIHPDLTFLMGGCLYETVWYPWILVSN
ncbi:hypothetical protein N9P22_00545 [Amylibacter sp.]|nr:hypothetical protein [Amylibacter sp.]MDA9771838.1 hypothetical protein [Amylibacter sp.]MDC1409999.1 hypothetical protein [Amylibacter sp.]